MEGPWAADFLDRDDPLLVHRFSHQQTDFRGRPSLGQAERWRDRRIGPNRGKERFERQPGIGLRAGLDRPARQSPVTEGERAGGEVEAPHLRP